MSAYAQKYPDAVVLLATTAAGEPVPPVAGADGNLLPGFTPDMSFTLPVTDSLDFDTGTLTSDATAPGDGDTVVIGSVTYTYKTALSAGPAVAYEVLIGADAAAALDNLKSAINATAGAGTTYGTGTVAHPDVEATTNTDTTQVVVRRTGGAFPDSTIPTTETSDHLAWGAATLEGAASRIGLSSAVGSTLLVTNGGSKTCFVKIGDSTKTPSTGGMALLSGDRVTLHRTTETHVAAACASGETTTLYITVGSGTP